MTNTNTNDQDYTLEDSTHLLIFTQQEDDGETYLVHAVGFGEEPNRADIDSVIAEVKDDPVFGVGDKVYDLNMSLLEGDDCKEFIKLLKPQIANGNMGTREID